MRKLSVALAVAAAVLASGATADAGSDGRPLEAAADRTAALPSVRFAVVARFTNGKNEMALHVRGASADHGNSIRVHLKVEDVRLGDGTLLRGPVMDEVLDGGYVYLRTPLLGSVLDRGSWVRVRALRTGSRSPILRPIRQAGVAPIYNLLRVARAVVPAGTGSYRATLDPADAIVQSALQGLSGGTEFRRLGLTARLDADGLVRSVRIVGRGVDGSRFTVTARLYDLGGRVRIVPPPPGQVLAKELLGTEM